MSLPPLLLALLAGLFLSSITNFPPQYTGCASIVLLLIAHVLPLRWSWIPASLGMVCLGLLLVPLAERPPTAAESIHRFTGKEMVAVTAEVVSRGRSSSGGLYFDLEAEKLVRNGHEVSVTGMLRLYLDEPSAPFNDGDRLSFLTRLRRPRSFGTPGEFNYPRYLAKRDIFTVAAVKKVADVAVLADRRKPTLLERWRNQNGEHIDTALAEKQDVAGLIKALAHGDRSGIMPARRDFLSRSGLAHLFAISGLHFGLVAGLLYALAHWLWRRSTFLVECCPPRQALPLLLLPFLFGYLAFSGEALSSWRAFLMLFAAALVWMSMRRVSPPRALGAVALIMLLVEPLLVFEAAFQLSFSATLAIMLVMNRALPILKKWHVVARYPAGLVLVTLTANVATLPILIFHFQQVAPVGFVANLFAVPLVSFLLLPAVLAGTLIGTLWPSAAEACFFFAGRFLELLLGWVERLMSWPGLDAFHCILTPRMMLLSVLITVVLFAIVCARRRWALGIAACSVLVLVPWTDRPAIALTALSVGQGEAMLANLNGQYNVLVDAGGFAQSSFDVGERLVVPALNRLGIERLDAVVLTHEHPDHMLGLASLLERVPVESLVTTVSTEKLPGEVVRKIASGDVRLVHPGPGWQQIEIDEMQLQMYVADEADSVNDRSLVVYMRCHNDGLLLTGDLEDAGVAHLLENPPDGPVTLLKLPHHGSRHSRQGDLLFALKPSAAVVSSGTGNRYRLPHPETVALYEKSGVPLWRTDVHGTLKLSSNGRGWRVTQWKNGAFR